MRVKFQNETKLTLFNRIAPVAFLVFGFIITAAIVVISENLKQGNIKSDSKSASESTKLESPAIAANYNLEPADINDLATSDNGSSNGNSDSNGEVLSAGSSGAEADDVAYEYKPQLVCSKKNVTMKACQSEAEQYPDGICVGDVAVVPLKVTTAFEYFSGLDNKDLNANQIAYKKNGIIANDGGITKEYKSKTALHDLTGGGSIENLKQLQKSESPKKAKETEEEYNTAVKALEGGVLMNVLLEIRDVIGGQGTFKFNPAVNTNDNSPAIINKLATNRLNEYQAPGINKQSRKFDTDECEYIDTASLPLIPTTELSNTTLYVKKPLELPFFGRLFTSIAKAAKCKANPGSSDCQVSFITGIKIDSPYGSPYQAAEGQASTIRYDYFRSMNKAPKSPDVLVPGISSSNSNPTAVGKYVKTACKVLIIDNTKLVGSSFEADLPCLWEVSALMAYCERQAGQNAPDFNVDCDQWLLKAVEEVQMNY
ncbi:MAG: hypothetical protein Fur003_3630 [Candidatus Dojkabacteria bacterium]